MFENLKQQMKEKKIEKLLHKILAELKEDKYDEDKIKAAFEDEKEMKEVLSRIYSWYEGDDEEDCCYYSDFFNYCNSRADGYSKQWALWCVGSWDGLRNSIHHSEDIYNKTMDMYILQLICASHYYQDYKDTDVALRDVELFISKECRMIEESMFKTACSKEMLSFCKKYTKFSEKRYMGKQSFQDKYRKLEYAYLAFLPSQTELKELPARVKRMDDDDKRDARERYEPIMCKYFAQIISNKLDINIEDKYKDVVALTVLMGLGDEKFIYVDKAIKYVDNTLSFLGLNVPFQDVERLCNAASEMCTREVALYREFLDSDLDTVEQLAKLVSEFGCTK